MSADRLRSTWRSRAVAMLGVAAFLALGVVCMRPFELRMATLHEDDGPMVYAYAMQAPAMFAGDYIAGLPIEPLVPVKVLTSLSVGLPAVLWRYAHIDPYGPTWVLTFVQGVGIGLACYVLAMATVGRRTVAVLAAVIAYLATPWVWSLANYGNDAAWTFVPYPATLALAFGLPGLAAAVRDRVGAALALVLVAGLIHPLVGLQACLIVGLFWLAAGRPWKSLVPHLGGLAAVAVLTVAPSLAAQSMISADLLFPTEAMAGLRQNAHIWPWGNPAWLDSSVMPTVRWTLVALLAWTTRSAWRDGAGRLWGASVVAAVAMSAVHGFGAVAEQPMLLGMIGLRAWMWPSILAVPLVAAHAQRLAVSGNIVGLATGVALVALPFARGQHAFSWTTVGLLAVGTAAGLSRRGAPAARPSPNPTGGAQAVADPRWRQWLWAAVVAVITVLFVQREVAASTAAIAPNLSDWRTVEVEQWARDHTPPGSRFVVTRPGWRTLSQRRRLDPFTREGYAYVAPRAARDWRDRLLAFYGVPVGERESQRGVALIRRQIDAYRRFGERDFLRFGSELGATHFVISTCYPDTDRVRFDLPVAYTNACYVVYEIAPARLLAIEREARDIGERVIASASHRVAATLRITPTTRETLPAAALDVSAGSISVWGRLQDPVSAYADLIRVNAGPSLYVYRSKGGVDVFYGGVHLGTSAAPDDRDWHHYVFTWRAGEQCLYVDSVVQLSASAPAARGETTHVAVGWLGDRDGEQWSGDLADVTTFGRPLTAAEVTALYRITRPTGRLGPGK